MRAICRTLLLCLTMLALPIQGMAGVGMLHCTPSNAPGHHLVTDDALEEGNQGNPGNHGRHQLHHGDPGASLHALDAAASLQPVAAEPLGADQKCSACAACCAAALLAESAPALPVAAHGAERTWTAATALPSFIASGLERPPRLHLA